MPDERFDVCVIGSGAAGGTLASQLVHRGARVALIEAGKYRDPSKLRTHAWPYHQAQPPAVPEVMTDPKREPVLYEGDPISVSRGRVLGGRTTHWNAVALRFSEDDFREWSANGIEEDWPLTYGELAPYYGQAEELMVVCGTRENLKVLPDGALYSAPPNALLGEHSQPSLPENRDAGDPRAQGSRHRTRPWPSGLSLLRPLHGGMRSVGDLQYGRARDSTSPAHGTPDPSQRLDGPRVTHG